MKLDSHSLICLHYDIGPFTTLSSVEGMHVLHWLIIGFVSIFVYLQIGYWYARLQWWSWYENGPKNSIVATFLFALSIFGNWIDDPANGTQGPLVSYFKKEEPTSYKRFIAMNALLWPILLGLSLFTIAVLFPICGVVFGLGFCLRLGWRNTGKYLKYSWFAVTEGPEMLFRAAYTRLRRPGAPAELTGVRVETTDALPVPDLSSVEGRNTVRLKEYRELCAKKLVLGNDITQVEERITTLEAEDDADNAGDAYRDAANQLRCRAEAT